MCCIVSKKKIVYKNNLHKYVGEDVEKVLRFNCDFNQANACIKTPCITNTMDFHKLVTHTLIPNKVYN